MEQERNRRVGLFAVMVAAFEPSIRTVENDFRHLVMSDPLADRTVKPDMSGMNYRKIARQKARLNLTGVVGHRIFLFVQRLFRAIAAEPPLRKRYIITY